MPTYEYECQKCGRRFDVFHAMSESPVKKCPECKGKAKRLIGGGAGVIFKGSGFYATDYKKGKKEEPACPLAKKDPPCKSCRANKEK